jgi:hypothetical protein
MPLKVNSPGGGASLGGAGSVIELRHSAALGLNLSIGNNTGWAAGGWSRYGGDIFTMGGVNPFDQGSGGSTPNRGYIHLNGMTWKRARETNAVATNSPIDWYCGACPFPILDRPPVQLPSAFSVWEVGCMMMLDALPVGVIARDIGLVFLMNLSTGYPAALRQAPAAGSNFCGFGAVYNNQDGSIWWVNRKVPTVGVNELVQLTGPGTSLPAVIGALRPVPVKFRFHSATVGAEAKVEVFLDGVLVRSQNWGPGTTLPVPADMAAIQAQQGYFRPIWRTAIPSTDNCALLFRDEYFKAAASVSLLD